MLSPSWKPPIYFLSLWICLFWTIHINVIVQYVVFCIWLLSLRLCFQCSSILYSVSVLHFFSGVIFCCMNITHFIYPFTHWWAFGLFLLFGYHVIMKLAHMFLHDHVFLFLSSRYLEVEWLGHKKNLCLAFWETAEQFSKVVTSFCSPTVMCKSSSFQTSSTTLIIVCLFYFSHSSEFEVVFYCGLICISLKTNIVGHLSYALQSFVYLL